MIDWPGPDHKEMSTLQDILKYGSGGATCSLVFRNNVFGEFPSWFVNLPGGDWTLQVLCSEFGKMYYFKDVMGVYRTNHPNNSLNTEIRNASDNNDNSIGIPYRNTLKIISTLNKYYNYRYSKLLNNQNIYCYYNLAITYGQHKLGLDARRFAFKCLREVANGYPFLTGKRFLRLMLLVLLSYVNFKTPISYFVKLMHVGIKIKIL